MKGGVERIRFFFLLFFLLHLYRQDDLDMVFFLPGVVEWKVWVLCEFLYIYFVRSGVVGLVVSKCDYRTWTWKILFRL